MATKGSNNLELNINSLEDYLAALRCKVKDGVPANDSETVMKNFKLIDEAARQAIWKLLFESSIFPNSKTEYIRIGNFLKEVKSNAAFWSPWAYNEWIVKVRDELLRRNMLDFWREHIVKDKLGPVSKSESDVLDASIDNDVSKFYEYGGCSMPSNLQTAEERATAAGNLAEHLATLKDYEELMEKNVRADDLEDDDLQANYESVSAAARRAIWQLLFGKENPPAADLKKAEELLQQHKPDASFYGPWDYNEWIVKVRDELLKRNMLEFWRDVIVKKELGLCWARDSDYFEDMEDEAPRKFYAYGGCKAPFE